MQLTIAHADLALATRQFSETEVWPVDIVKTTFQCEYVGLPESHDHFIIYNGSTYYFEG